MHLHAVSSFVGIFVKIKHRPMLMKVEMCLWCRSVVSLRVSKRRQQRGKVLLYSISKKIPRCFSMLLRINDEKLDQLHKKASSVAALTMLSDHFIH